MVTFFYLILVSYSLSMIPPSQATTIIILAGQSNMSGRGGVINATWDGIVPPESRPNPAVLRLSAELAWVEGQEPLHRDIDVDKTCGVGPGMAFANSVLARDPSIGEVALVPCAIGGTNITQWARGSELYKQLVIRTAAAVQGGGTLGAMLWYQGESDTVSRGDAEMYKGRLERFFEDLRLDLQYPMLPIIQVALASGEGPYIDEVREAQFGTEVANVRFVDAKGLELEPDRLHLTTSSQVRLGRMLADEFLGTLATPVQSHAPKIHSSFLFLNPFSLTYTFRDVFQNGHFVNFLTTMGHLIQRVNIDG